MSGTGPELAARPGPEEFRALAEDYAVVPVWCEMVADTLTPVGAFLQLVGDRPGFLLESVEGGERWGRYSFVGRSALGTIVRDRSGVRVEGDVALPQEVSGVLDALRSVLAAYRSPSVPGLPPLHGGLVGYLGYDVVREIERLPAVPPDDLGFPDAALAVIGQLAAFDHWGQRVLLVDNVIVPEDRDPKALESARAEAVRRLGEMAAECCRPLGTVPAAVPEKGAELAAARRTMTSESYRLAVEAAKEYIYAGDIFQVVLSQRFDLELGAHPFDVYRALRLLNPSPYLYFLRFPEVVVVGSSPEPMVRLRDGLVTSRPIAGSRPRGATEEDDRRLAGELSEDPKELAEHVMLVDLARNDVGRVVALWDRARRGADDRRALQPHHAPDVAGERRAGSGAGSRRRPAGHPAGRHALGCTQGPGHGDHRRARADQAGHLRRASSGTSTSPATSTPPSPSGRS